MATPAKPANGQAAGSALADAIAGAAAQQKQKPAEDPEKKWDEMGAELYAAMENKDKSAFGRLFAKQVKLAVKEALRGN
jgi:hypothetical protein